MNDSITYTLYVKRSTETLHHTTQDTFRERVWL